jgi:hypothetical protein
MILSQPLRRSSSSSINCTFPVSYTSLYTHQNSLDNFQNIQFHFAAFLVTKKETSTFNSVSTSNHHVIATFAWHSSPIGRCCCRCRCQNPSWRRLWGNSRAGMCMLK